MSSTAETTGPPQGGASQKPQEAGGAGKEAHKEKKPQENKPQQKQQQEGNRQNHSQQGEGGGGGGGRGRGRGGGRGKGRRGGGGGGDRNHKERPEGAEESSLGEDPNAAERRKRPDAQHYKPGAFKKHDGSEGGEAPSSAPNQTEGGDGGGGKQNHKGGKNRGGKGRGGKGSGGGGDQAAAGGSEVDKLSRKAENLSLEDNKEEDKSQQGGGGGTLKGRKKGKPEQQRNSSSAKNKPEGGGGGGAEGGGAEQPAGEEGSQQQKKNKRKNKKKGEGNQEEQNSNQDQKQQQQQQQPKQPKDPRDKRHNNAKGQQQQQPPNANGHSSPLDGEQPPPDSRGGGKRVDNRKPPQEIKRNDDVVPPRMRGDNKRGGEQQQQQQEAGNINSSQRGGGGSAGAARKDPRGPRGRGGNEEEDQGSAPRSLSPGRLGPGGGHNKSANEHNPAPPPESHSVRQQQGGRRDQHHNARGGASYQGPPRDPGNEWGRRFFRDSDSDHHFHREGGSGGRGGGGGQHFQERDRNWEPESYHGGHRGGEDFRGGMRGGRIMRGGGGGQFGGRDQGPPPKSTLPPRLQRAKENQGQQQRGGGYDDFYHSEDQGYHGRRDHHHQPHHHQQQQQQQQQQPAGGYRRGMDEDPSAYRRPRNDTDRSWREDSATSSNSGYHAPSSASRRGGGGGEKDRGATFSQQKHQSNSISSNTANTSNTSGISSGGHTNKDTSILSSSSGINSSLDLTKQQPKVIADWGAEVEEEEENERQRRRKASESSANNNPPTRGTGGGLIRLPPNRETPWATGAPSSNQKQQQQQSDHPAWRGMQPDQQRQWQKQDGRGAQNAGGRVLFDPKNPNKPLPEPPQPQQPQLQQPPQQQQQPPRPHYPQQPNTVRGPEPFTRFPVDPRFQHGGPRPPFASPLMGAHPGAPVPMPPRPPGPVIPLPPAWYNVQDPRIYGNPGDTKRPHDVNVVTFIAGNDMSLKNLMLKGGGKAVCQHWDTEVSEKRKNIQQAFEHLLKTDLLFCAEFDIEFHVWKIAFYQIVEVLKNCLKNEDVPPEGQATISKNMSRLLDDGLEFYAQMLDTLDDTYRLDLDTYFDVLEPRPEDKRVKCALMSAQKCLLCLGDLARYKEQIEETSNFGKARQYYQQASNIEPRNGRPFNQLAILALNTKRKFEAVYYNMRCLQSKNPFPSSQESLTVIFEGVKQKWETTHRGRMEEQTRAARELQKARGTRVREEIWTRPDGGRRLHRTTSEQEQSNGSNDPEERELQEMATSVLNRRFINSFLYLIGKLFTNINMESFQPALELLQKEFRVLVSRMPLPIDSKRLVQIMALNMFVIERSKVKAANDGYRSALQEASLRLAFSMFEILVARCNTLLADFQPRVDSSSKCLFEDEDEDLSSLLSAVKVWCDWLLGNNDMWFPVVSREPFQELAKLATRLEILKPHLEPVTRQFLTEGDWASRSQQERNSYELVKLTEDAQLSGFFPWLRGLDWSVYRRYCPRSVPAVLTQDAKRLDAINFCVDFLEGLEPPVLKWSKLDNAHISLVECPNQPPPAAAQSLPGYATDQDSIYESYSDDDGILPTPPAHQQLPASMDAKTRQLKLRKDELQRSRAEVEREQRRMQRKVLSDQVSVFVEVCPRFIVPDTNCFVDHLPELRRLAKSGHYQLRVPVVVLNELDGLAKGAREQDAGKWSSADHAAKVCENARAAVSFLRERPLNVKCVTSKGTVLPSLNVTTEEDAGGDKKNDDLILDACLNCSSATPSEGMKQRREGGGATRVVHRTSVLLTDDKNLKLKAHVLDMPVNKIGDFIKWAFGSNGNREHH